LVDYTAPVYWLFLAMSGLAVMVMRVRKPNADRPFRTPLYPVLPMIFVLSSLAMLVSSLSYVTRESGVGALVSLGVLATGVVAFLAARRAPIDAA
jgi:amino acid transporter